MIELLGIFAFIVFAAFVGMTTFIIVVRCAVAATIWIDDIAGSVLRRIIG